MPWAPEGRRGLSYNQLGHAPPDRTPRPRGCRGGRGLTSLTVSPVLRAQSRFAVLAAAAPAVLLLAHVLPDSGPVLALRLAGAAACVLLLPGALVLRAVAWPASPAIAVTVSFVLSLALAAFALALTFAVGASIVFMAGVLALVSACAAVAALLRGELRPLVRDEGRSLLVVLGAAIPFAGFTWRYSGLAGGGDLFFHMARARKLAELDSLGTLASVGEFEDGGLHAGYAFPLWQAVDALVARLAGVDVADVMVYLPAVLVPLAFVLAYAAGSVVFRSPAGGLAFVAAQVAYLGFFGGAGSFAGTGFFERLTQPQSASLLLLAPAIVALAFAFMVEGGWILFASLGAAALSLTLVHPTYTPYVALVLGGFLLARVLLVRGWEPLLTRATVALAAILAPFGLYSLLLLPVAREGRAWTPSTAVREDEVDLYGNAFAELGDWLYLAPHAIARPGAVVVAGLLAVPLAAFAARRLWAALVLGGSLAVLIVLLTPPLFTALSDTFSISQARRLPQFLPIAFAVAGACVVLSRLKGVGVALAAAAGLALVLVYPGEFGYTYGEGGPGWVVWAAVAGGLVALVAGAFLRLLGPSPSLWSAAAAVAFVLPVAIAGVSGQKLGSTNRLTPGVVEAVRSGAAPGDVVFSDPSTAYLLAGLAPVYVNAAPPAHVMDTPENRPRARARAARRFLTAQSLTDEEREAILERAGADWVLIDRHRPYPEEFLLTFRPVFEDDDYALYQVTR